MKCSEFERLEMKYLDGDISPEELDKIKEHTDNCNKCSREFQLYEGLKEDFALLPLPQVPDNFTAEVMHSVRMLPKGNGRLMLLVLSSVIAAVSSVTGFLNLVVINSHSILEEFAKGDMPSPLVAAVKLTAAVGNGIYDILSKMMEFTYNPGILVFVLMGLGLYVALKRSIGGVHR